MVSNFLDTYRRFSAVFFEPVIGYTRLVLVSKTVCVVIALFLSGILIGISLFKPAHEQFNLTFSHISNGTGDKPSMVQPRLYGVDSENQPYHVSADSAVQESKDEIVLYNINADIALNEGTWMAIMANSGLVQPVNKTMDLLGEVNVFTDSGFEFKTQKAFIDIENNSAYGTDPIEGHGPMGLLRAHGFRMDDRGKSLSFGGRVKLTIYPDV